jgi:hypothetical protein
MNERVKQMNDENSLKYNALLDELLDLLEKVPVRQLANCLDRDSFIASKEGKNVPL